MNHYHEPTTNHPKLKRPTKANNQKKEVQEKKAHAEGTCLRYPPQAVPTRRVGWGVEPILKQPDLPT